MGFQQKEIENEKAKNEIDKKGYFTINGEISTIKEPTNITNNNTILLLKILMIWLFIIL